MVITINETVKNVSSIFLHIYAFTHLKVLKQERPTQTISSQLNSSKQKQQVPHPIVSDLKQQYLISEERHCCIVVRGLALVFLYGASTFGRRNTEAAEFQGNK